MGIISSIIIGGVAGYAAEQLMKASHGIFTNIFVGMLGGVVGGVAFGLLGLSATGLVGSLVTSLVGACLVIWIYRAIRNKEQGLPVDPIMPKGRDDSDNFTGMN